MLIGIHKRALGGADPAAEQYAKERDRAGTMTSDMNLSDAKADLS